MSKLCYINGVEVPFSVFLHAMAEKVDAWFCLFSLVGSEYKLVAEGRLGR